MNFANLFEEVRKYPVAHVSARTIDGDQRTVPAHVLLDEALALSCRLSEAGVEPGMQIGIQAQNCYEYLVWDLAAIGIGAVLHAIPEDLPATGVAEIVKKHRAALWVFEAASHLEGVGNGLAIRGSLEAEHVPVARDAVVLGNKDIHSRVYSSGSSGHLKGLDISRKGTELLVSDFIDDFGLSSADSHLIFLPLSNYQQRLSVYGCLWSGVSFKLVGHTMVFQEIGRYAPSFIVAPPAIYDAVNNMLGRGADASEKLKAFFGGNIRFMITGMAPIKKELLVAFNQHGLNLLEAYGVTETGMIAWNTPTRQRAGTVGRPIHPEHVQLTAENEILIRRPFPLSCGYFDSSADDVGSTFLADGTIATGDIGVIDGDGFLSLHGRKKEIMVTSGGSKFHPEEIERALLSIEGIRSAVVTMSKKDGKLVAILVADDACDPVLLAGIEQGVRSLNDSNPSYKRLHRKVVTAVLPSIENRMLTRNLKCDRRGVYRYFQSAIEAGDPVPA